MRICDGDVLACGVRTSPAGSAAGRVTVAAGQQVVIEVAASPSSTPTIEGFELEIFPC